MFDEDIFMKMSNAKENSESLTRELRVLSGIHSGAAIILSQQKVTIGSESNCTIVLLDEGVMSVHQSIHWIDGKGWAKDSKPETILIDPFLVGPVWMEIATPGSPWRNLEKIPTNAILTSEINVNPTNRLFVMSQSRRRFALISIIIFSTFLLLFIVWKLMNNTYEKPASKIYINSPPHDSQEKTDKIQPKTVSIAQSEEPNKEIVATFNGAVRFVIKQDGRRVYVGETNGDFVLIDLQGTNPVWRHRKFGANTE